jgi:hypothetical protein
MSGHCSSDSGAPSILIMGVYNKMVKQHGSDSQSETRAA